VTACASMAHRFRRECRTMESFTKLIVAATSSMTHKDLIRIFPKEGIPNDDEQRWRPYCLDQDPYWD
jgi:hypothetical protein